MFGVIQAVTQNVKDPCKICENVGDQNAPRSLAIGWDVVLSCPVQTTQHCVNPAA